jgi:hypothetical protein
MPKASKPASELAKQRWRKVPKQQRQEIARQLSLARWGKLKASRKPK